MITCSKCHKEFPIELNKISKDSHIACLYCGNPCLVKLFDLQHHEHDEKAGFGGIEKVSIEPITEKIEEKHSFLKWHSLAIIGLLKILLILFIIGMIKIEFLNEKFPSIARLYNSIHIFPEKKLAISNMEILDSNAAILVKLKVQNMSENTELLSDIEILILDGFHNPVAVSHVKPYSMIQGNSEKKFTIKVFGITAGARYISVFINGKPFIEKQLVDISAPL